MVREHYEASEVIDVARPTMQQARPPDLSARKVYYRIAGRQRYRYRRELRWSAVMRSQPHHIPIDVDGATGCTLVQIGYKPGQTIESRIGALTKPFKSNGRSKTCKNARRFTGPGVSYPYGSISVGNRYAAALLRQPPVDRGDANTKRLRNGGRALPLGR